MLSACRVHQWVKNLLIFVPALMAHRLMDTQVLFPAVAAFFAFSFCASAVYLLNDIVDVNSDRQHPTKSKRPIAAGTLTLPRAYVMIAILLVCPFLSLPFVNKSFFIGLAAYFTLTLFYSFWAKKIVMLDILCLATLYTIRIFAGGLAANVPVSHWMLVFSVFIFISLACVKRFSELYLKKTSPSADLKIPGRGYIASDLEQISQFGTASGYIAVLVLGLYINSPEVSDLYTNSVWLWLIAMALLYWIGRVWIMARRGLMHEDPIVFAIRDRTSYFVGLFCLLVLLIAS
jgi:4-hydroxybenzoate polyprenyltransferase